MRLKFKADGDYRIDPEIEPYRKLLFAILERAMLDYKGYGEIKHVVSTKKMIDGTYNQYHYDKAKEAAAAAAEWINSNNDEPFTLLWILEQLDISYLQFSKMLASVKPNQRFITNYVRRY